jgi:outer membrane lipoprotein carrier protein
VLLCLLSFGNMAVSAAAPAAPSFTGELLSTEPADRDAQLLEIRLQELATYSASFTQDIQGARGQLLERSSGRVSVLRPAFRWQVDDPYPQIIVADQALLKIYDPDLEQLTIRPMDEALKDTPISLLSRDAIALNGDFVITRVAEEQGEMFIVVPRSDETLYAEIRLQFSSEHLVGLGILDHLGQYTQISFTPDADSTVIQSSDFQLEVPPGTDVIGG